MTATRRLRPGRDVGPLITHDQWETVQRYFKIAAEEGARAEIGGTPPSTRRSRAASTWSPRSTPA